MYIKLKRFSKYLITIIFLIFSQAAFASTNLQEVLSSASENNPELKSYDASVDVARSEKYKALGGFLPKVSLDVNDGTQKTQIGSDPRFNGQVDRKSITVSQELFNGGHTIFDIRRADNQLKKESSIRDSQKQSLLLNVIAVYLELLKNEEILKISEQNLRSQKKLLRHTRKKFKARYATRSELAKVVADKAAAISNKQMALSNIQASKSIFHRLTSLNYDLVRPLQPIDNKKKDYLTLNAEEIYKKAIKQNPEFKSAKYSYRSAKYESRMAKSDLSPSVKFNFESSKDKNSFYFNNQLQRNTSVYLSLHVPLFNSGISFSNVSGAKHRERKEKYSFDNAKIILRQEIQEEVSRIHNLESQYESAKQLEAANETLVKTLKVEEKLGTKSIMELLRAKKDLYQSKTDRVTFYYDKLLAYYRLKSLEGESLFVIE